jgi:heme exporter protein D
MNLTLGEFIYYIWLPIFIFLLIVTIILSILYLRKKRAIKRELMLKKKELEDKVQSIMKELEAIIDLFHKLISEKNSKTAIIQSYIYLSNFLEKLLNIKVEPYLTEKERINEYNKTIPSNFVKEIIYKLYLSYEKVRFGEHEPTHEEINEFLHNLKELSSKIQYAIT